MRLLILEVWQPDCPVVYTSEKIENIRVYAIESHIENSNIRALLHMSADDESSLQTALDVIKNHSQVKSLRVLWKCQQEICAELICNVTNAMHSLARAPIIFQRPLLTSNGLENWVVLVENKTSEKEVLCYLKEDNEVRVKKRIWIFPSNPYDFWLVTGPMFYVKLMSMGTMLRLSTTQQKVFSAALEGGYYSYPRKTNLKQLSEKLGISKTAVAKNLRSIENKAIRIFAELTGITEK